MGSNARQAVRWPRGMYGCPIPMREDRAVAADIETVCQGLHRAMMRHDPSYVEPASWEDDARYILAAVFSEVEDG